MGLDPKLLEALEKGRAAWPKIAITSESFVEHLSRHAASAQDPAAFVDAVHASDLYLACGVLKHDRAALAYFEDHFMARVPEYILRVRVGRDVVDDVQQKLRERLIMGGIEENKVPKIADYSGKGALGGWLRVAATRTALNQLRSSGPATEGLRDELALASSTTDPQPSPVTQVAASEDERGSVGVPTPPAKYCKALGYIMGPNGCTFPDGTTCEGWSFYRGACGQAHSYCNLHGGRVSSATRNMGTWTAVIAVCDLDGKQCEEETFVNTGKCGE